MSRYDFCVMNYDGVGLPWAVRLTIEGYDVVLYNPKKGEGSTEIGKGIVEVTESLPVADVYVFDSTLGEAGKVADSVEGIPLGASEKNSKLEKDRGYAAKVAENIGLKVPLSYDVTVKEALAIIRKEDVPFVWKSSGDSDANFSVTEPDPIVLEEFLSVIEKSAPDSKGILQQYVEGIPTSFSGWFDGERFYQWWVLFEDKRFRAKGIGENTGCEISLVSRIDPPEEFIPVGKFEEFLRGEGMPGGEYDINVMMTKEGVYWLEFGPRFGWDMDVTYLPLIENLGEELLRMAGFVPPSQKPRKPSRGPGMALSVRLSVPPYPYHVSEKEKGSWGHPVFVEEDVLWDRVYLYSVREEEEYLSLADRDGLVGISIGVGRTFGEAARQLDEVLTRVHSPGLSYRGDYKDLDYIEHILTGRR